MLSKRWSLQTEKVKNSNEYSSDFSCQMSSCGTTTTTRKRDRQTDRQAGGHAERQIERQRKNTFSSIDQTSILFYIPEDAPGAKSWTLLFFLPIHHEMQYLYFLKETLEENVFFFILNIYSESSRDQVKTKLGSRLRP